MSRTILQSICWLWTPAIAPMLWPGTRRLLIWAWEIMTTSPSQWPGILAMVRIRFWPHTSATKRMLIQPDIIPMFWCREQPRMQPIFAGALLWTVRNVICQMCSNLYGCTSMPILSTAWIWHQKTILAPRWLDLISAPVFTQARRPAPKGPGILIMEPLQTTAKLGR